MYTAHQPGIDRRFHQLLHRASGRAILVHPNNGAHNRGELAVQAARGGATGVVVTHELACTFAEPLINTPLVLHIGRATMRQPGENRDALSGTIETARKDHFSAIMVPFDCTEVPGYDNTFYNFGDLIGAAYDEGMPVIADVYIHAQEGSPGPDAYAKRVRHSARIVTELGATAVILPYTGSRKSFATCVGDGPLERPVLVRSQPNTSILRNLQLARDAVEAGAQGVLFTSDAFAAPDAEALTQTVQQVVHSNAVTPKIASL